MTRFARRVRPLPSRRRQIGSAACAPARRGPSDPCARRAHFCVRARARVRGHAVFRARAPFGGAAETRRARGKPASAARLFACAHFFCFLHFFWGWGGGATSRSQSPSLLSLASYCGSFIFCPGLALRPLPSCLCCCCFVAVFAVVFCCCCCFVVVVAIAAAAFFLCSCRCCCCCCCHW